MEMRVTFYKLDEGRLCGWAAEPPKRKRFQGTTMASGRDLPHDLAQFVVEAALGMEDGFWGLLANGATFKSVPGRRRTQPGQALIREHREALNSNEHLVNAHVTAWRLGDPTPAGHALDVMFDRWQALPPEGSCFQLTGRSEGCPVSPEMVPVLLGYPDSEHLSENEDDEISELNDDLPLPKPPFPHENPLFG